MKQAIYRLFALVGLTLCFLFCCGGKVWARHFYVNASRYGVYPGDTNASPKVRAMILALKARMKEGDVMNLRFAPGVYHFRAEGADVREYYISNHDQVGERPVGLCFEGFSNLKIIAEGVEFRFDDRMLPLSFVDCSEVVVKGCTIDFSEPQISQAEIIENRGKEGGISFRPAPWVKWRINEQGYFEAYGSNWSNVPMTGIVFEKESYRTAYRISDLSYSTEGVQEVGEGILNAPKWIDERLKPGMIVAMRTYERPQPAVFVDNSKEVNFVGINVHYADGMGFLVQNSEDIALNKCNVKLRSEDGAKPKRYFTTQADATHFSGCSSFISVYEGLFEAMMDDAINVHGFYLKMLRRLDEHTVEAAYMHEQGYGFAWGRVGDSVRLVNSLTFDSYKGTKHIRGIQPVDKPSVKGAKIFRISFKEALEPELQPEASIVLENLSKIPSVRFCENHIRNNRARGALFNTSGSVKVRRNHFDHIAGAAIVASTDANQWFESGQTRFLDITNNVFEDVLTSLYQFTEAVITLHPVIPKLAEQKAPFYGGEREGSIQIQYNVFKTFDIPLLYAKSVQGLTWEDNEVERTTSYPPYHWNKEVFRLEGCRNIKIDALQTK